MLMLCDHRLASALLRIFILPIASALASYERAQQRLASKPWFAKNIEIGELTLPVSPVTLVVALFSIIYLIYCFREKPCWAVASHILVSEASPATKAKMEQWKKEIGNDVAAFAKYASKYSECPSKQNGGNLGKFKRGNMVPPFEKLCFSPGNPTNTTLGPIQTQFGWHLIYMTDREIPS